MSTYNSHNNNLEALRERRPEVLSAQRLAVISHAVENLRPQVRLEAEITSPQVVAAQQFERQVANSLQSSEEKQPMSQETLASVTDLKEYRQREAVDAAYESQGNPLFEDLMRDAEKAA